MRRRNAQIQLSRPIDEVLKARILPYSFEVGVLEDRIYRNPTSGMKALAGKQVRRTGRSSSGLTVSQVSAKARKALGINYLTRPFKRMSKKNQDAMRVMRAFWDLVFKDGKLRHKKRLENAIQAVVRNPLTRADYGRNRPLTAKIKGSNRKFIDTGQLFKAIRARVRVSRVSR